jgi:hypothetical protein
VENPFGGLEALSTTQLTLMSNDALPSPLRYCERLPRYELFTRLLTAELTCWSVGLLPGWPHAEPQ